MKVLVTGAGGFVGSDLVARLLTPRALGDTRPDILATDARLSLPANERLVQMEGDLTDPAFRTRLTSNGPDIVFHLAAIPGGAAANDYELGWRVNVDATAALFEGLAHNGNVPRVVFASSIGVFGVPLPRDKVDDDTLPIPTMSYGMEKLVGEGLVTDFSRRGKIDGIALRLPGIVARPPQKAGHLSAYMSNIFHALAAGKPFTVPVSAQATSWFMSRQTCVDNLVHAANLPAGELGLRRFFCLPALRLSMTELIGGLAAHFGAATSDLVTFEPNSELEAQFGNYPLLETPMADALGFRHDGDAAMLVARALNLAPIEQGSGHD